MIISVFDFTNENMSPHFTGMLGTLIAHTYNCKILLVENSKRRRCLGDVLISNRYSEELREGSFFYSSRQPGEGLASFIAKRFGKPCFGNYVEILSPSLYYSPHFNDLGSEPYEMQLYDELLDYLYNSNDLSQIKIINTDRSSNLTTTQILSEAGRVVVLIDHNIKTFQKFSSIYRNMLDKCIFVVLNSNEFQYAALLKDLPTIGIYRWQVTTFNYTDEFFYNAENGRLVDYVLTKFKCSYKDPEHAFISNMYNLIDIIISNKFPKQGAAERVGFYQNIQKHNIDNSVKRNPKNK